MPLRIYAKHSILCPKTDLYAVVRILLVNSNHVRQTAVDKGINAGTLPNEGDFEGTCLVFCDDLFGRRIVINRIPVSVDKSISAARRIKGNILPICNPSVIIIVGSVPFDSRVAVPDCNGNKVTVFKENPKPLRIVRILSVYRHR